MTLFLVSPFLVAAAAAAPMPSSGLSAVTRAATYPADPPAPICGNSAFLSGPTSAPGGAVTVPQGDNSAINWNLPGATFWFAAGSHSLGGSMFSQIMPAANTTFLGAPNAVLDGNGVNRYAFTQSGTNVTIRYLNIQGFVPPHDEGVVNHDSAANWVIQDNWIHDNTGAAVMVGPGNVVAYNCIANNGQYGFNAFYAPGDNNITIDHNEISGNDTSNLDLTDPNCGCFGGGKIWNTMNGSVTNNWVHDNGGPGIWADTNNAGILIDGNYIADNDGEAIFYEISYNAQITNNNILRNNIVKGKSFAAQGSTFPAGAIYISNAGGDSRVDGGLYSTFTIAGNNLVDNWGGVTLWEDANRFCGSGGDSGGFCTLVNPLATLQTCVAGTINLTPYVSDCRWKTQNVSVHDNQFNYSAANVGCTTTGCGEQAIIANAGSAPSWTPYPGNVIDTAVTTQQNNLFSNNTYVGDWQFAWAGVSPNTFTQWQGGPSYQDPGSTFNGATFPPSVPGNLLDADTASLEGSMGHWTPWFSAAIATSTAQAHNGTHSLAVSVTAPNGWGIQLDVWPGFTAAPGPQTMSFWGILGSGNVGATMQVKWLDSTGAVLATKSLGITTLTTTWSRAVTTLTAPAGTAYAGVSFSASTGVAGDTLFLDQIYLGPSQPTGVNYLDAATASLETSIGHWVPWFSTGVARVAAQAQSGTHSLRVNLTAANGWGVQLNNAQAFPATAGPRTISFWGRLGAGTVGATMQVQWLDSGGVLLGTGSVSIANLTMSWQLAIAKVTAPTGTAFANVTISNGSSIKGSLAYFDQIYAGT